MNATFAALRASQILRVIFREPQVILDDGKAGFGLNHRRRHTAITHFQTACAFSV